MNCCLVLSVLVTAAYAAPQGYQYRDPTLVAGQNHFPKFGPLKVLAPCTHANGRLPPPLGLINAQSEGRIVNHKVNYENNHNVVFAGGANIPQKHFNSFENHAIVHNNHAFNSESAGITTQLLPPLDAPPAQYFKEVGLQQVSGSKYNTIESTFNTFNSINANKHLGSSFIGSIPAPTNGGESLTFWHPSTQIVNENSQFNTGALHAQLGNVIRETVANAGLDPSIEKHVYVHVPPEDLEEESHQKFNREQVSSSASKKHYKIIFIKAPSYQSNSYNQLPAAPAVEEKTLVYVLVKKPDEAALNHIQQQSSYKTSKPEVYFIKYKTREEGHSGGGLSASSQNLVGAVGNASLKNVENAGLLDIRSGHGDTGHNSPAISAPQKVTHNEPKHELYGVPLQ